MRKSEECGSMRKSEECGSMRKCEECGSMRKCVGPEQASHVSAAPGAWCTSTAGTAACDALHKSRMMPRCTIASIA